MAERQPIAFFSYVHSDDEHDGGKITSLRQRLEGEVRMHTGKPFAIFQDRNDLAWGQSWQARIHKSLTDVTFLIPVVTPSFFESPACRDEFTVFAMKEKTLGVSNLILPIYYLSSDQMEKEFPEGRDGIADMLRSRQWTDWRPYRFKTHDDTLVAESLASMAATLKAAMRDLEGIMATELRKAAAPEFVAGVSAVSHAPVVSTKSKKKAQPATPASFEDLHVQEVRPKGKFKVGSVPPNPPLSYYIYTKSYDEVVLANELADAAEMVKFYNVINSEYKPGEDCLRQMDAFESGLKDALEGKTLSVSILVDNSGSMRGARILYAAGAVLHLTDTLERLGARVEVIGYTTRSWKGGKSRELWVKDGKPSRPGRLNDIRYIIYKTFDQTLVESAPNMGVMIKDGLLKENIDGEAIVWALRRLEAERSDFRIMLIVSDGAPVDDSTLAENGGEFLHTHAKRVVSWVKGSSKVSIAAIGIEEAVSDIYGSSAIGSELDSIPASALSEIFELVSPRG